MRECLAWFHYQPSRDRGIDEYFRGGGKICKMYNIYLSVEAMSGRCDSLPISQTYGEILDKDAWFSGLFWSKLFNLLWVTA